jgi:hypothetical protein
MHEIDTMDLEESADLYNSLPAPKNAAEIAIVTAVGDRAHALRIVARAGEVKRKLIFTTPKEPEGEEAAAPVITKRPKWKTAPKPAEAETGGALFFMQGLKKKA